MRRYADSGAASPCVGGISGTDFDATLEALAARSTLAGERIHPPAAALAAELSVSMARA